MRVYSENKNIESGGYTLLLSILVVGAVALAITLSVIMLGLGVSRTSLVVQQLYQARGLAQACVEEGLQQIRDATPYTGSGNLSLGQGSCTYTVTSQGGQNRTVTASGTVGTVVRRITVVVGGITPQITITSWQDVAN